MVGIVNGDFLPKTIPQFFGKYRFLRLFPENDIMVLQQISFLKIFFRKRYHGSSADIVFKDFSPKTISCLPQGIRNEDFILIPIPTSGGVFHRYT